MHGEETALVVRWPIVWRALWFVMLLEDTVNFWVDVDVTFTDGHAIFFRRKSRFNSLTARASNPDHRALASLHLRKLFTVKASKARHQIM